LLAFIAAYARKMIDALPARTANGLLLPAAITALFGVITVNIARIGALPDLVKLRFAGQRVTRVLRFTNGPVDSSVINRRAICLIRIVHLLSPVFVSSPHRRRGLVCERCAASVRAKLVHRHLTHRFRSAVEGQ